MFLTITPNLCIERTVLIEEFEPRNVHRIAPENLWVTAGGKGINAARIAAHCGCEVTATGWVGSRQRAWFDQQLASEGVPHQLVEVETDTRICTNILDGQGHKTELLEAGNPLAIEDGTRLLEKCEQLFSTTKLGASCGSYPPSSTEIFDSHLTLMVKLAKKHNVRMIVDGKGRPFEMAVRSGAPPWCVKPNLDEAAQLLHRSIEGEKQELRAVKDILNFGVEVVLLSCGERGAYLGTKNGTWVLQAPQVQEVSPVGSGDAVVGAFAAKYIETGDLLEAARWGIAAGSANAAQIKAAVCTQEQIAALVPLVRVSLRF